MDSLIRRIWVNPLLLLVAAAGDPVNVLGEDAIAGVAWNNGFLTVRHRVSDHPIVIQYLEAYCRPGSTDREWSQTVIPHTSKLESASPDGMSLRLLDRLQDGVVVTHRIDAAGNRVTFEVVAENPTDRASDVSWAQPCLRVANFAGGRTDDFRDVQPQYIQKCFLLIDGKPVRLPTTPWERKARYTPGQVYCPKDVDRGDVNPRPLSSLVPSHGVAGCYSRDEKHFVAMAWQPYQEVFQGVIGCMHVDFRIGGLAAGEKKTIRGAVLLLPADRMESLKSWIPK